ncbi:MAG TPA: arabinose ABC transporter permease [Acidobacteria bacterium]|nr:arabinose ABC transporter permease [Acidobacteriota bacterium]
MVADRSGKSSENSSDNSSSGSRSVLSVFGIRSFRYQWSADAMSTWGSEMETLILGWYILVATDSPFLVGLLGALRFSGTITAPVIGVIADRVNRKVMLISLRIGTVLTAMVLLILAVSGLIQPWHVFIVAGFSGLLRPADNVLRQSLIADTVPRALLMNASGFARTTQDSARIVGALLGATLLSRLGLGWALTAVSLFYAFSVFFGLGIRSVRSSPHTKKHMNPLADMKQGAKYIMDSSALQPIMFLAFLVNATAFPFTNGLLPVVARDVYGHDENGLAVMIATFAGGALIGSLLMAAVVKFSHPERFMMLAMIIWHLLLILFAQTQSNTWGLPLLALIGVSVSFCMITMSVVLLTFTKFEMRGRVMGVRMLAVYALPMGMVLGGWLIEQYGVSVTITGYAVAGLVAIVLSLFKWPKLITGFSIVERG